MSLYDFFLPEVSEASQLRRIAENQERFARAKENENANLRYQNNQLAQRVQRLEYDVGSVALMLAAVVKKLDEKGQITRDELKHALDELDLLDGLRDGKISV